MTAAPPRMGTLLGTLRFPPSVDVMGLFLAFGWPSTLRWRDGGILLDADQTVTTNTYFNSFYESTYARHTSIDRAHYALRLSGDFRVSVHRRCSPTDQECLSRTTHLSLSPEQPLRVDLPSLRDNHKPGRVYLEITSLKDGGTFHGGDLLTDEIPPQDVALGIITCTYKRNTYVRQTVDAICAEPRLRSERIGVFVVDNARDLPAGTFDDPRVQVIPNDNVGGSGGFNRGLLAAASDERFTHFLMMDDDIVLCAEVLLRLVGILKFARNDLVVCGSMLPRERPYALFEAGALYGVRGDRSGARPLACAALKQGLYLQDPDALDKLLLEERFDYGGLWFLSISRNVLRSHGYLMPFFIKGDDREYCMRVSANGEHPLVAFPSIAVFHDAFDKRIAPWEFYYYVRNGLVCHTLRQPTTLKAMLRRITEDFFSRLLAFDYAVAELTLLGAEHFLQGPGFLISQPPAQLHAQVTQIASASPKPTWDDEDSKAAIADGAYLSQATSLCRRILGITTLGGHLWPQAALDRSTVLTLPSDPYQRLRVFPHTRVRLYLPEQGFLFREMDRRRGLALIRRWLGLVMKMTKEWSAVSQAWRDEAPKMVTEEFWRELFALPKRSTST